jgi:hypothetical protein
MNAPDPAMAGTDTGTDAGAAPAAGEGQKKLEIIINGDGTFTVNDEAGQPTDFGSVDELLAGIKMLAGGESAAPEQGHETVEGTPGEEGAESPEEAATEPPAEGSAEDLKAKYAQKKGTRPKMRPDFTDYFSGAPK